MNSWKHIIKLRRNNLYYRRYTSHTYSSNMQSSLEMRRIYISMRRGIRFESFKIVDGYTYSLHYKDDHIKWLHSLYLEKNIYLTIREVYLRQYRWYTSVFFVIPAFYLILVFKIKKFIKLWLYSKLFLCTGKIYLEDGKTGIS